VVDPVHRAVVEACARASKRIVPTTALVGLVVRNNDVPLSGARILETGSGTKCTTDAQGVCLMILGPLRPNSTFRFVSESERDQGRETLVPVENISSPITLRFDTPRQPSPPAPSACAGRIAKLAMKERDAFNGQRNDARIREYLRVAGAPPSSKRWAEPFIYWLVSQCDGGAPIKPVAGTTAMVNEFKAKKLYRTRGPDWQALQGDILLAEGHLVIVRETPTSDNISTIEPDRDGSGLIRFEVYLPRKVQGYVRLSD